MKLNKLILILLLALVSGPLQAADLEWSWIAPTEREDNTDFPPEEIGGFKIYYSTDGTSSYDTTIEVPAADRSYILPDVIRGATYKAVFTTVDTGGRESVYSVEAVNNISPLPAPASGTVFTGRELP